MITSGTSAFLNSITTAVPLNDIWWETDTAQLINGKFWYRYRVGNGTDPYSELQEQITADLTFSQCQRTPPDHNPCGPYDPCPLTITINDEELAVIADPCDAPAVNYEAVDSDGNAISTSIVGGRIVANDLPCTGADCPYDGIIQVNGVPVDTFGPFDPCVNNTLTLNLAGI